VASPYKRTLPVDEERVLAARLAGILFLITGVTAVLMLFLPGIGHTHWRWVVALALACALWATYCLTLAKPEEHGPWFWHVPAAGALGIIAGLMAATGGAASPARFYVFFLLLFVSYFYPPWQSRLYLPGCAAVALSPLVYEPSAVDRGYVGELVVIVAAYVTLGLLIANGKQKLVGLREQAHALALRDPLTDLPNRRALLAWLRRRGDLPVGLILVDLDGFKDVNTLHGYSVGDAVLRETGHTLQRCVRSDDFVARLGGDEFAVLAVDSDVDAMTELANRVLEAVRAVDDRLDLQGVALTASVGWALYPVDAATIDDLIAVADSWLRGAKVTGKNRALSALRTA
jgi:diguanylate cyclase (GGDEF)-like protein